MFEIRCSFCNKTNEDVEIIVGPEGSSICNACVDICTRILGAKTEEREFKRRDEPMPTPTELKDYLDDYVIGQEEAKKVLSVGVYNHYKRIAQVKTPVDIEKSNIMLAGPTGCGKTLLVKTLARKLNVPFAMCNATSFTEAGYVGEDVEGVLFRLLQNAKNDVDMAQKGIIYIDEIDKISKKDASNSSGRDVSGEGVQQALLQIMEGTIAEVPPKNSKRSMVMDSISIDTTNILFICGGAFSGLDKLVEDKKKNKAIGFGSVSEGEGVLEASDFISFGLIPEFLGRLPIVTMLHELSEKDLASIIVKPKNSLIKQYVKLFAMDDVKLTFTKEAIKALAKKGYKRGVGARGLRSMLEKTMSDTMFLIPKSKVTKCKVTKSAIEGGKIELEEG